MISSPQQRSAGGNDAHPTADSGGPYWDYIAAHARHACNALARGNEEEARRLTFEKIKPLFQEWSASKGKFPGSGKELLMSLLDRERDEAVRRVSAEMHRTPLPEVEEPPPPPPAPEPQDEAQEPEPAPEEPPAPAEKPQPEPPANKPEPEAKADQPEQPADGEAGDDPEAARPFNKPQESPRHPRRKGRIPISDIEGMIDFVLRMQNQSTELPITG